MPVTKLLENNASFLKRGYTPPSPAAEKLLLVADSDARLTGLLEPALGIAPGSATQIRLAGAWGGNDGNELFRSVLLAIHQDGCREVVVVGCSGSSSCPADRQRLRSSFTSSGLAALLPDGGDQLLERVQGPDTPEQAVRLTVHLLRERLLPDGIPVHGVLLDPDTGRIQPVESFARDSRVPAPAPAATPAAPAGDIPGLVMPELPALELPEIPPLDLDAIMKESARSSKKKKRQQVAYGQGRDTGPVSFDTLASQRHVGGSRIPRISPAPPEAFPEGQLDIPRVEYANPAPVKVADTGLAPLPLGPVTPTTPATDELPASSSLSPAEEASARPSVVSRQDVTPARSIRPRPEARREAEQPEVTPLVGRFPGGRGKATPPPARRPPPPVMTPLGERVLDFDDDDEKTPVPRRQAIKVDLNRGFVQVEGADMPLDPRLQMSLLKVKQFLARELGRQSLSRLVQAVRRRALDGEPAGEMLKAVITPILRLGKKRYAVINDLLTLKEQLPRLEGRVAAVIIEELVGG